MLTFIPFPSSMASTSDALPQRNRQPRAPRTARQPASTSAPAPAPAGADAADSADGSTRRPPRHSHQHQPHQVRSHREQSLSVQATLSSAAPSSPMRNPLTSSFLGASLSAAPFVPASPGVSGAVGSGSGEQCAICLEPLQACSLAPCGHRLCFKCTLNIRVLCESKSCPHCRTDNDKVYMSNDPNLSLASLQTNKFATEDVKYGIVYQSTKQRAEMDRLFDFKCAKCFDQTGEVFKNLNDLKGHLKSAHDLMFCDLCVRNLKIFPSEQPLYTKAELTAHRKFRQIKEGGGALVNQGHPVCDFCNGRAFFDNEQLYKHLKDVHEHCQPCIQNGNRYCFYPTYAELLQHFRADHFFCEEPQCVEQKYIAFATHLDLQTHTAVEHRNKLQGMQRSAQRSVLRIDPSAPVTRDGAANDSHARFFATPVLGANPPRNRANDPQPPESTGQGVRTMRSDSESSDDYESIVSRPSQRSEPSRAAVQPVAHVDQFPVLSESTANSVTLSRAGFSAAVGNPAHANVGANPDHFPALVASAPTQTTSWIAKSHARATKAKTPRTAPTPAPADFPTLPTTQAKSIKIGKAATAPKAASSVAPNPSLPFSSVVGDTLAPQFSALTPANFNTATSVSMSASKPPAAPSQARLVVVPVTANTNRPTMTADDFPTLTTKPAQSSAQWVTPISAKSAPPPSSTTASSKIAAGSARPLPNLGASDDFPSLPISLKKSSNSSRKANRAAAALPLVEGFSSAAAVMPASVSVASVDSDLWREQFLENEKRAARLAEDARRRQEREWQIEQQQLQKLRAQELAQSPSRLPPAWGASSQETAEGNSRLRTELGKKFEAFKSTSDRFNNGEMSAEDYYLYFREILGAKAPKLFNELVDLVPSMPRRVELLRVHQDAKIREKQEREEAALAQVAGVAAPRPVTKAPVTSWGKPTIESNSSTSPISTPVRTIPDSDDFPSLGGPKRK